MVQLHVVVVAAIVGGTERVTRAATATARRTVAGKLMVWAGLVLALLRPFTPVTAMDGIRVMVPGQIHKSLPFPTVGVAASPTPIAAPVAAPVAAPHGVSMSVAVAVVVAV